ncbi:MAG: SurA N-terminal domain-containing protein [Thermodesulfobacteriota bacterium]
MSLQNCMHCGKEIGEEELYCPECQALSGTRRPRRLWIFSILFSGLLLFLTGLVLWHGGLSFGSLSLDWIWEKPAAVINGESISRTDLKARVRTIQAIVERQHGKDIFAGERGRALLANLNEEVLNGMLEEKLMCQEARKLGVQITDEQVKEKLDRITKEVFGTRENFQARLQEDGISKDDLQNNLRSLLILEALKKAKVQRGADPDVSFSAWLIQAKQKAELVIYDSNLGGMTLPSMGACCGPGGPGEQPGAARSIDSKTEKEAERAGLEAFQKANPSEKRGDRQSYQLWLPGFYKKRG